MNKVDCIENTLVIDTSFRKDNANSNKGKYKQAGVLLLFISVLECGRKSDNIWIKNHSKIIKVCKSNILGNTKSNHLEFSESSYYFRSKALYGKNR